MNKSILECLDCLCSQITNFSQDPSQDSSKKSGSRGDRGFGIEKLTAFSKSTKHKIYSSICGISTKKKKEIPKIYKALKMMN